MAKISYELIIVHVLAPEISASFPGSHTWENVGMRQEIKKAEALLHDLNVHLSSSVAIAEVQKYAQQHKLDVHYVSRDILDRLSQKRPHQVHMEVPSSQPPGFHCLVFIVNCKRSKTGAEKAWG